MENLVFNKDKYVFSSVPPMLVIGDEVENSRNKQVVMFLSELTSFNVLLKDLISFPIKESQRNVAINVAYYIINSEELFEMVIRKKDLPILKLSKITKLKVDYLEKMRDYIIAYFIILFNPNYKYIQEYLSIRLREDNKIKSSSNNNKSLQKGLVIRQFKRSACILTSKGEFFKIKTSDNVKVGEICEGREKKVFGNYKIHISILLVILIMIGSSIIIEYRRTQSIIIIDTTSSIKVHINKLNKVIYAYSATDKGKELIDSTNIVNKDIDGAMTEIFEYSLKNGMIDPSKKVLVTIIGQPIKYGILAHTDKFISENNIPIVINNAGNQQKLPKYLTDDQNKKEK